MVKQLALLLLFAGTIAVVPHLAGQSNGQSRRVLVPDVEFVGWRVAAMEEYTGKDVHNPSEWAALRMVFGWCDSTAVDYAGMMAAMSAMGHRRVSGSLGSLNDLRAILAKGQPVGVVMALTPWAHPLYESFEMLVQIGAVKVKLPETHATRLLGTMLPLKYATKFPTNPLNESVTSAARVVVGMDDDRQVVIVHEPSFGPAWEVAYRDFDAMWVPVERSYFTCSRPAGYPGRTSIPPYRARAATEQAAESFVWGNALHATEQAGAAERVLRQGLAVEGLPVAYAHLLYYELAGVLEDLRRRPEAVEALRVGIELLPENYGAWQFLSELLERDDPVASRTARLRADSLVKDSSAVRRLAMTLPADFLIAPFWRTRGWAPAGQPVAVNALERNSGAVAARTIRRSNASLGELRAW